MMVSAIQSTRHLKVALNMSQYAQYTYGFKITRSVA